MGQRRRRRAGLTLAFAILLPWAGMTGAEAGAWNEEAGHGVVILDYTFSGGSKYFNGEGKLSRAAAYRKQEVIGYVEYGLTDWLTLIVKPSLAVIAASTSVAPDGTTKHYAGLGTSEAGAQLHVLSFGPAVFALQGSFRLPGTTSQDNPAAIGNTSSDLDVRGLAGLAFGLGPWPSFLDAQAGYRLRSSGAPAEWHADLTLGARVRPAVLILLQSFNVVCDGPGTAWFPSSSWSKLAGSVVYDVTDRWSVELGVFQTMFGVGALRERGLRGALWYRF